MKNIKSLLALAVAVAMVFSMCLTGFAVGEDGANELGEVVEALDEAAALDDVPALDEEPASDEEPTVPDDGFMPDLDGNEIDVDSMTNPDETDDGSLDLGGLGDVEIQLPDEGIVTSQDVADYLDTFRDWNFEGALVYFVVMESGLNTVIDSFNVGFDGEDYGDLRMVNFGYDPDTDTFHAFEELDNGFIMDKMAEMGITNMSELVDWLIEEPLQYVVNPMSMFEASGGTPDVFKLYVTSASGTSSDTYSIEGITGPRGSFKSKSEIPENGIKIKAEGNNKIKSITIVESGEDFGQGGARARGTGVIKDTSETVGYRYFSEIVSTLQSLHTLDDNPTEVTLSKLELTMEASTFNTQEDGTVMYMPLILAKIGGDILGGQEQTISALVLEVETEPLPNGTVSIVKSGDEPTIPAGQPQIQYMFNGVGTGNVSTLQSRVNTALETAKAGDHLQITLNDVAKKYVAGFAIVGGNGEVEATSDNVTFTAGQKHTCIAIVYKNHPTGFTIKDTESNENTVFFSKYVTNVTLTANGGDVSHHDDYNSLLEAIKKLYVGDLISLSFSFRDNYKISKLEGGGVLNPNGVDITGIPVNGKGVSFGVRGIEGTWKKDSSNLEGEPTADGIYSFEPTWTADTPTALTLTMQSSKPSVTISGLTSADPGLGSTKGVYLVAAVTLGTGDNNWSKVRLTMHGEFTSAGENPNEDAYVGHSLEGFTDRSDLTAANPYYGIHFIPKDGNEIHFTYKGTVSASVTADGGDAETSGTFTVSNSGAEYKPN